MRSISEGIGNGGDLVVPPPELDSVHVWWARPADARPWLSELFDDDERGRLAALRHPVDRHRFAVGCGLLRLLAGAFLGQAPAEVKVSRRCQECGKPHGKPRLGPQSSRELEMSVSHGGERVLVACTFRSLVGVDVEPLRSDLDVDDLIDLVASPTEAQALAALPLRERVLAFLVCWTRKEALLKATGHGLMVPMTTLTLSSADGGPRVIAWPSDLDASTVSLHDLDMGPGHVAALAVVGRCSQVVVHDGSALLGGSPDGA